MALVTPNVPYEQQVKQTVRQNTRGGDNSYSAQPLGVINAASTTSGLWQLVVTDTATAFTISGTGGNSSSLTGATTVSGFVAALQAGPLANIPFTVPLPSINTLNGQIVDVILLSGTGLGVAVASGVVSTATLTNVVVAPSGLQVAYPNYTGTPNAAPSWVDGATVHAFPIYGMGNNTQDTSKTVQVQVRQIQTAQGPEGSIETQVWTAYQAAYQSNLNQTRQKNTQRQQ